MGANSKLTFTCSSCGHEEQLTQSDIMAVVRHPSTEVLLASLGGTHQEPTRTRGNVALERTEDGNLVARRILGQVETKWVPFQRHKYKVSDVEERRRNGITFDSKLERNYYDYLCRRVKRGEVIFFLRQVPFHLPGKTVYRVDFQEFHSDGTVHFVDVKGMETETFRLKLRQVEDLYPITLEIVKAKDLRKLAQTT